MAAKKTKTAVSVDANETVVDTAAMNADIVALSTKLKACKAKTDN